ncbi:hypothetical protein DFJ77DRAFT_444113 [Powellomyces hirtus]|nr:hypothetical protein DFJ77DRAFT_444245 [Powellomyces hirtus]KAI8904221.1 hypothetical protein DFJ77DRAFT_444113 [Powellomyces hirtus]
MRQLWASLIAFTLCAPCSSRAQTAIGIDSLGCYTNQTSCENGFRVWDLEQQLSVNGPTRRPLRALQLYNGRGRDRALLLELRPIGRGHPAVHWRVPRSRLDHREQWDHDAKQPQQQQSRFNWGIACPKRTGGTHRPEHSRALLKRTRGQPSAGKAGPRLHLQWNLCLAAKHLYEQGTVLTEAPCTNADNLLWYITEPDASHVRFKNIATALRLDNPNRYTPGTVAPYSCGNGNAKEWGFTVLGNGVYQFISRASGLCLNFAPESLGNGTELDTFYCHNAAAGKQLLAQTWTLISPLIVVEFVVIEFFVQSQRAAPSVVDHIRVVAPRLGRKHCISGHAVSARHSVLVTEFDILITLVHRGGAECEDARHALKSVGSLAPFYPPALSQLLPKTLMNATTERNSPQTDISADLHYGTQSHQSAPACFG